MEPFICTVCNYVYDHESAERTPEGEIVAFHDVDVDWTCPNCNVGAQMFIPAPLDELEEHAEKFDFEEE